MRIATWNLERLKHYHQIDMIVASIAKVKADILVLSETDIRLDQGLKSYYKNCIMTSELYSRQFTKQGGSVNYLSTERRVAIYTDYEVVSQYTTHDNMTSVCASIQTESVDEMIVYGTVMGIFGNRHTSYQEELVRQLRDIDKIAAIGKSVVVAGDFNCSFSDNYYFTKTGRNNCPECFSRNHMEILTAEQAECIDHIAVSKSVYKGKKIKVQEWNLDKTLSDHKGIVIEF